MANRVTIEDVARETGVSVGTVSRVLNDREDVNPEIRERVRAVIGQLGYQPRRRHRVATKQYGNRSSGTGNIGFLVLGMNDSLIHMPKLNEILHGVESAMAVKKRNLMLANIPKVDRIPPFVRNRQVDGLIVRCPTYDRLPLIRESRLIQRVLTYPLVWVIDKPPETPGDLCSYDHQAASRCALEYIQRAGHTHVGFLNVKKGQFTIDWMKAEFHRVGAELGLRVTIFESRRPNVQWPERAVEEPGEVMPLVEKWIDMGKERPSVIFTASDSTVVQLYAAFRHHGFVIGKDISLISCSNRASRALGLKPALTRVDINAMRIGSRAVEQLLWRIDHCHDGAYQKILFEPFLLEGKSVSHLVQQGIEA